MTSRAGSAIAPLPDNRRQAALGATAAARAAPSGSPANGEGGVATCHMYTTQLCSLPLAARLTKVWLECRKGGCDLFRDRMPQMRLGKVSISGPSLGRLWERDADPHPKHI